MANNRIAHAVHSRAPGVRKSHKYYSGFGGGRQPSTSLKGVFDVEIRASMCNGRQTEAALALRHVNASNRAKQTSYETVSAVILPNCMPRTISHFTFSFNIVVCLQ
jgi:hypothetical protein